MAHKHLYASPCLHVVAQGLTAGRAVTILAPMKMLSIFLVLGLLAAAGCSSSVTRNTQLDHRLRPFVPPMVELSEYKSAQSRGHGQDPDLALAVAISGGGHRAANFGIGVLLAMEGYRLDDKPRDLLREVDYFSTVSGGGFAAGAYISTLYDHLESKKSGGLYKGYALSESLTYKRRRLQKNLERDYQGSIIQALFHPSCIGFRDAGDLLELRFDRFILGSKYRKKRRSIRLGDIFKAEDSPDPVRLPYWVTNATVYENGARFPFTPGILRKYGVDGYVHNMKNRRLKGNPYDMPVAVGVKTSASFPIAIPATTFRCRDHGDHLNSFLHLMDGGLTDNMGVITAVDLLKQDKATRKVLIVIDAYKGVSHPYSRLQISPSGPEVAYRIMTIGLDSEHSQLEGDVEKLASSVNGDAVSTIHVIHLSFESLKPQLDAEIEDTRAELKRLQKEWADSVVRRAKREIDVSLKRERAALKKAEASLALYQDARAVATSLNITRGEQQLLLDAGKIAVQVNKERIRSAVLGIDPAK